MYKAGFFAFQFVKTSSIFKVCISRDRCIASSGSTMPAGKMTTSSGLSLPLTAELHFKTMQSDELGSLNSTYTQVFAGTAKCDFPHLENNFKFPLTSVAG